MQDVFLHVCMYIVYKLGAYTLTFHHLSSFSILLVIVHCIKQYGVVLFPPDKINSC